MVQWREHRVFTHDPETVYSFKLAYVRLGLLSLVFIVKYALGSCKEVAEQEKTYFVGSGVRKFRI